MTHSTENVAAIIVLLVGTLCLALLALGLAAWRRSGNRKLLFPTLAFGLFAVKSFLTSWALIADSIAHQHLELVNSLFDLGIVALLVAPFLRVSP